MTPKPESDNSPRVHIVLSARASGPSSGVFPHPPARDHHNWEVLLDSATREVFELMLGTPLLPLGHVSPPRVFDYTAMIGLAGQICGVLSLRCTAASAFSIAARMLGVERVESEDSVRDAIGEMCNIAAGNFKTKIAGMADQCYLSVPMVVSGRDYQLHPLADGARIEIVLGFQNAPLWVTLDLHG